MTEKENNNQLSNINELERKITSPKVIDYLAGKVKEHDLGGIKLEVKHPNGSEIGLSIWDKGNKKEWKTLKTQDVSTIQPKQPTISDNQVNFLQAEEKPEILKADIGSTNNNNGNSGSNENNES